jgi:pyrroline-5-carboxylate reductase
MVTLPSIAILGTGSMGGAILSGLVQPDVHVEGGIRVTNRTAAKAQPLASDRVQSFALEQTSEANARAVAGARIVILGVKPYLITDLLKDVAPALEPDALVVSVAAGIPIQAMEQLTHNAVLRAMPNTPSSVGRGVTGLAGGSRATAEDIALVKELFETVGSVLVVDESQINALSTVSGSGPAYVFYLIEQLTASAVDLGFSPADADLMVRETFLGASELLAAGDIAPAELRRRVTSPKGTTEKAVEVLESGDLKGLFDRALASALARAAEIAAESSETGSS